MHQLLMQVYPYKSSLHCCSQMSNYSAVEGQLKCKPHFQQLFPEKLEASHPKNLNLQNRVAVKSLLFLGRSREMCCLHQDCLPTGEESRVNYWIHNGFVTANDETISKSVGNFFTIHEVTKLHHTLALSHFLL